MLEEKVGSTPLFCTRRFDVYKHEVTRNKDLWMWPRSVYQAWFRSCDVPRPVCVVTINQFCMNYVEWIYVEDDYRRQGIATEIMKAIESEIGECTLSGATEEGEAFVDSYSPEE